MAETNLTSSATNSDCDASSPDVSPDAGLAPGGISRRDAMNMMATVAAVPCLTRSSATSRGASGPDQRAWLRSRDAFLRAKAESDENSRQYHQAWLKYNQMKPTLDRAVKRDLPGGNWSAGAIAARDLEEAYQWFCAGEGRWWWARDREEAKYKARKALNALAEYRSAEDLARRESGCTKLEEASDAIDNRLSEAETNMLRTPAPDHNALMFKLEHLFGEEVIEQEDGNIPLWDTKWVRLVMADARRLLTPLH